MHCHSYLAGSRTKQVASGSADNVLITRTIPSRALGPLRYAIRVCWWISELGPTPLLNAGIDEKALMARQSDEDNLAI